MRAILAATLAFAALETTSFSSPASADSAIAAVREGNQQPNGRWPAMDQVDCVVPYCIHNPDGSLNHDASTKALENAQNYNTLQNRDVNTHQNVMRSGKNSQQKDERIYGVRSPIGVQSERPVALIDGGSTVARRFAPPASTTPQVGLFSEQHNIER